MFQPESKKMIASNCIVKRASMACPWGHPLWVQEAVLAYNEARAIINKQKEVKEQSVLYEIPVGQRRGQ